MQIVIFITLEDTFNYILNENARILTEFTKEVSLLMNLKMCQHDSR